MAAQVSEKITAAPVVRERLLMDSGWRFAFGHPTDVKKDFGTGTGYFSYLTRLAMATARRRPISMTVPGGARSAARLGCGIAV